MKISETALFRQITEKELSLLESNGCIRLKSYGKDETILHAGAKTDELGIVLEGTVFIEHIDFLGNKSIISSIHEGNIFAETYALCSESLMVDAVSSCESAVLFLNVKRLAACDKSLEQIRQKIMKSLLFMSAQKNLTLSSRIFCTSPKSARMRILAYLSSESTKSGSLSITIPFNRQQMADYLNLDRSALSKELCRMRDDGIISFRKNSFTLLCSEQQSMF